MTQHQPADLKPIAERNLFGVKREELNPQAALATAEPGALLGTDYREADLKPCTVQAALRGTLVADAKEWSIAIAVSPTTKEPEVYSANDGSNKLADDATIVDIRPREIVVRRRDHFELCTAEGETATPTLAATTTPPAGDEGAAPTTGGGEGVTKVSDTQYEVEGNEIDRTLGNLNEVATQARIVPSFQNGKADGFKLFSIKPGSIYSKIGLQNGDVIRKINGYEINSPDKALEIYQKLRDAQSVNIELKRRGRDMSMQYNIKR
jgi:general secretion pathway protein C